MNSGQEGSMCTLHANSADEVFGRILMLAQRGQLAMPPAVIHLEVGMARPFVVHIRKDPAGSSAMQASHSSRSPFRDGRTPPIPGGVISSYHHYPSGDRPGWQLAAPEDHIAQVGEVPGVRRISAGGGLAVEPPDGVR